VTFFPPPIPVFILDFSFRPNLVFPGWGEPAATSAPVHNQAIQAILGSEPKTHPPLPKVFSFFSLFSAPKFFAPTYLPHLTKLTSFCTHFMCLRRRRKWL
jgi:hypothetical protein